MIESRTIKSGTGAVFGKVLEDGEALATTGTPEQAARIAEALIKVRDAELPGGLTWVDRYVRHRLSLGESAVLDGILEQETPPLASGDYEEAQQMKAAYAMVVVVHSDNPDTVWSDFAATLPPQVAYVGEPRAIERQEDYEGWVPVTLNKDGEPK